MGILNSKKSGLFAMVQPSVDPSGSIVPTTAIAPQELIMANASVTLENSPIERVNTLGIAFSQPSYPGAISGTATGFAKVTSGYSKVLMVNGYPAVSNSAKKMMNNGNTGMAPMVQSTQAKSYVWLGDNAGGGGSGMAALQQQLAQPACKFPSPTPVPKQILGTCQYYEWRNQDFIKQHQKCGAHATISPPDYYLNYGYKYCERFSTVLYPKLDQAGKIWLTKARYNLQTALEQLLQQQPNIELNNEDFQNAVFKTHRQAYEQAGFDQLGPHDWCLVGLTPDKSTWKSPAATEELFGTGVHAIESYYGPNILKEVAGAAYTLDVCTDDFALQEVQKYYRFTYFYK